MFYKIIADNTFYEVDISNVIDPYDVHIKLDGLFYPLSLAIEHEVPEALSFRDEWNERNGVSNNYVDGNFQKTDWAANTARTKQLKNPTHFHTLAA